MNTNPRSWLDQLIGTCFSMLLGAAAIYMAVQLLEAVWRPVLLIMGIVGVLSAAVMVMRARNQGW